MNTAEKTATDAELNFWKDRANRLRWALIDIATGAHDGKAIKTLAEAKRIASNAIEFERQESARGAR